MPIPVSQKSHLSTEEVNRHRHVLAEHQGEEVKSIKIVHVRILEIRIRLRQLLAHAKVADLEDGRHQMLSVVRVADQDYENTATFSISSSP